MKLLLLLALLAVFVLADREYKNEFRLWAKKFAKTYSALEMTPRFNKWKRNLVYVESHNARADKNFTLGMNQFADLSHEEFKKIYLTGLLMNVSDFRASKTPVIRAGSFGDSWDWRSKGAVTPVKNQGQCGGCWSFSSTGSTEGCDFIKNGKLKSMSEQNLIDCSSSYGNQGCNGGLMTSAFDYIIANKGIDSESSYPYEAKDDKCRFNSANVVGTLSAYSNVASGDENALATAGVNGPVSVAIDASHNSFQLYTSGVYYEPACSSSALDHGVLMVGAGSASQGDYWIVKNSWGADWGLQGYIWMARNKNNNCGIATAATLAEC